MTDTPPAADPYDLARFLEAQAPVYDQALAEIRRGRKQSHWMWFVFPQIDGLGSSQMAKRYAIRSREEARAYLDHPVLGPRLRACAEAVLSVDGRTASEIFGSPDDVKLRSSATLFAAVSHADSVFERVLARYYGAQRDARTIELLGPDGPAAAP